MKNNLTKKYISMLFALTVLVSLRSFAFAEDTGEDAGSAEAPAIEEIIPAEAPETAEGEVAPAEEATEAEEELISAETPEEGADGYGMNFSDIYFYTPAENPGTPRNVSLTSVNSFASGYSAIVFTFTDESGTSYEAVISGIKTESVAQYSDEATLIKIASDFITKDLVSDTIEPRIIEDPEDTANYTHDLIDAEKTIEDNYDSQLCWAATASNMLWQTGWAQDLTYADTGEPVFENEDELFDYFILSYSDSGSVTGAGIEWYLNGFYRYQKTDTEGTVLYRDDKTTDLYNAAQLLENSEHPGTSYTANGGRGFYSSVIAASTYDDLETDDLTVTMDDTVEYLKDGYSIGLSLGYYQYEVRCGGHATTLMGYIKEMGENVTTALKAIFMADSDNNCVDPGTKEDRVNTYTMYLVEKVRYQRNFSGYMILDYNGFTNDEIFLLKPANSTEIKEEDPSCGTTDILSDLDFVAKNLSVLTMDYGDATEVDADDELQVKFMAQNYSYATVSADKDLILNFTVTVYKEGKAAAVKTLKLSENLRYMRAASTRIIYTPLTAEELGLKYSGDYTITLAIDGYTYLDAEGTRVEGKEAYTGNNVLEQSWKIKVNGEEEPESPATAAVSTNKEVFKGTYMSGSGIKLAISFTAKGTVSPEGFLRLTENGVEIDSDCYSVTIADDGTYILTFEEDFLATLRRGVHEFILWAGNDFVPFEVTVI